MITIINAIAVICKICVALSNVIVKTKNRVSAFFNNLINLRNGEFY